MGHQSVVAAYESLYEGYGQSYDFPSEFSIVADQNNTICTITPSTNLRVENGIITVHKAHVPFTDTLQRGECIQYKAVLAQNCDEFDVTGTMVSSSHPVGIVGGSQCPNIPCENPYCDHVCEMIPPVRTWGRTYLTMPFATRVAGDSYLIIGSKDGQSIYRNDDGKKTNLYCTIPYKYSYYLRPDVQGSSVWTSDAPFLVVQYINSTTFEAQNGGSSNGKGDPAMVVINSVEHFTTHFLFQTPNIQGAGGFTNYANVFVDTTAIIGTTIDGTPINQFMGTTHYPIPGSPYIGFRIANLSAGKHEVVGPRKLGIYLYGYGSYDSYAWSGNLGISTTNSPDTLAPLASAGGKCFATHIGIGERRQNDSRIASIVSDSIFNMQFNLDPLFIAGALIDTSFYDLHIVDSTKEAYAKIYAYDVAGNRTGIISTFKPQFLRFSTSTVNFGTDSNGAKVYLLDTICNAGTLPYHFTAATLHLAVGNTGFALDSVGADGDIPAGECRIFKVSFLPLAQKTATDTIVFDDACFRARSIVFGTGGVADFTATGADFKCHFVGTTTKLSDATLINISNIGLAFDSIIIDDKVHFGFSPFPPPQTNVLPFVLAASAQQKIEFSFTPDSVGSFQTIAHYHCTEVGWKTALLKGCGLSNAAVENNSYASSLPPGSAEYISISSQLNSGNGLVLLPAVPNPASHRANVSVRFIFGVKESGPLNLSLFDQLGKSVAVIFDDNYAAGIYETRFTLPATLAEGNYIYRLAGNNGVASGKLVLR
ncbi:MAG: T9SS type A sorting domain-containing protein [Ignavibacteriota bacterium]